MRWTPERLIDEVALLGARGLPRKEFFAELAPRLRSVIDNDASCWHTLDPHTRLMTSDSPDELIERGILSPDEAPAAGELLLRSESIVELITPPARELLASMRPDGPAYADDAIAASVLALASFVRGAPEAGEGGSNVVTVPGSDGWITLHASLPGPPGDGRVAVVIERAGGARSATVRLEAFGATARQREIATLLARGPPRAAIA